MSAPMPRQKGDARAFERPDDEVVRRLTERGLNADLMRVGQLFHLIQTTPADDPDLCFFHIPHPGLLILSRFDTPHLSTLSAAYAGDAVTIQSGDVDDEVRRRADWEFQRRVLQLAFHFLIDRLSFGRIRISGINVDMASVNLFLRLLFLIGRRFWV